MGSARWPEVRHPGHALLAKSIVVVVVTDDLYVNADVVMACVDLASRTGASGFELGHVHEGVPVEEAGWYAHVNFKGTRLMVQDKRDPTEAAMALAERLLAGATCRCLKPVTLSRLQPGSCRWRLIGPRWQPGCDAPSLKMEGEPGDYNKIQEALAAAVSNRAARRAAKRRRG